MMKREIIFTGLITGVLLMGSCSSGGKEEASARTNATTNNNLNSSVPINAGEQVAPPQTADANAVTGQEPAGDMISAADRFKEKLKNLPSESGPPVDVEKLALKSAKPAPDNSTFTSYLTDVGYEIRTFRSHPQLAKVEKRLDGSSQTVKVYFRNGRVVEIPGTKIPALGTARAAEILAAAGVASTPQNIPASDPSKTGAKTPGE